MWRQQNLYFITGTAVVFLLFLGTFFLMRTGLPSADVVAKETASRPVINVSDFELGDVEILWLNNRRVIVWRRNEADQTLAENQNTSEAWRHQTSTVSGQAEAVFADDANLTLDGEWFFALAEFSNQYQYILPRAGEFEGFLEGRYAAQFDLAGRIRKGGGSTNLTVIEAEYVDDGQGIRLYLDGKL
jgi:ubiquinol-cytochrome c reductase iron-sulfur subunit